MFLKLRSSRVLCFVVSFGVVWSLVRMYFLDCLLLSRRK
jgi:hypothetical protein